MSSSQDMKPATAAKKLGVHLPETPQDFQDGVVSRDEFDELVANPPEWLETLRRDGPHPRPVVAQKLTISESGLRRAGMERALTTVEIKALLADQPDWLREERSRHAEVQAENARVKQRDAKVRKKRAREAEQA